MARYTDYIKALEADDGNPEGSGSLILEIFTVEGFGTDGNYGRIDLPLLELEATGINRSVGTINLPSLSIESYSGTHGKITLPFPTVQGERGHSGSGSVYLPHLNVIGDGQNRLPPGGYIDLPMLELIGRGGVLIKIYKLCENENSGL